MDGLRNQDSQTSERFWRAEAQLAVRREARGVNHEKPGLIRGIASLCNLVFGVGFRLSAPKKSLAAIERSAARPCPVRERRAI